MTAINNAFTQAVESKPVLRDDGIHQQMYHSIHLNYAFSQCYINVRVNVVNTTYIHIIIYL